MVLLVNTRRDRGHRRVEKIELVIGIVVGIFAIAGTLWKVSKLAIEKIAEPVCDIKGQVESMEKQIEEILDIVSHNGNADRYLLQYRIEQLCFKAFATCKRTGRDEIDKDILATINNMHAEYKYFGGNSVIDIMVARANRLHVVE